MSLWFQKDGGAKSKQIWTNLSHWNTGGSSYRCEELLFLNSLWERSALEMWHTCSYRRHLLLHKHTEVLELRSVIFITFVTKISKFRLKCLLMFFPIHNTSICWATFRVMILGRYVIVDDGGNSVTFSQAVHSDKEFLKNYNSSQRAWTACIPVQ